MPEPGSKHDIKEKEAADPIHKPHHQAIHEKPLSRVDPGGGTAKRNIIRRGGGGQGVRKEKANKHHSLDDDVSGEDLGAALDENDPNFVSSEDPAFVSNVE